MLKEQFNIMVILQVLRSPYANLLDLTVWCSLQDAVEKEHYMNRMNVHALVDSVEKAWKGDCVDDIIRKVWNRLRNFLALVVDVDGGNNLVEKKKKMLQGPRCVSRISSWWWNNYCFCHYDDKHKYRKHVFQLSFGWWGVQLQQIFISSIQNKYRYIFLTHLESVPALFFYLTLFILNIINFWCVNSIHM